MKQMIKRKDGSYSQRGLWDNIRAKRGSGKKPTLEMLKQERKIKRNMAEGGKMPTSVAKARFVAANEGNVQEARQDASKYGYKFKKGGRLMESYYMKNGGMIPDRYKNMGFNKVGTKKQSTRPGKKWMVLAKKGDQYKVVHGGYKGMQDFTQHGNEQRKKNFWNRMGGKSSSKATDPFSPLYWHKRFGTW